MADGNESQGRNLRHDYDDDAVCRRCGHDGAEWWHWKNNTWEGRASDAKEPSCREVSNG